MAVVQSAEGGGAPAWCVAVLIDVIEVYNSSLRVRLKMILTREVESLVARGQCATVHDMTI